MGRRSDAMAARLRRDARAGNRVFGTGFLDLAEIAAHLSACDVLVQPYPDGVSGRRTSLVAALALGVPTVTNGGFVTEYLWESSGAVQLVSSVEELAPAAAVILADPDPARSLALRARRLYEQTFALEVTIDRLRSTLGREAA
jgi:glycosyltransferase involved in cell wall biosynthesis